MASQSTRPIFLGGVEGGRLTSHYRHISINTTKADRFDRGRFYSDLACSNSLYGLPIASATGIGWGLLDFDGADFVSWTPIHGRKLMKNTKIHM